MRNCLMVVLFLLFCNSCKKDIQPILNEPVVIADGMIAYIIPAGSHYSVQSAIKELGDSSIFFEVKFDSSAIYKNTDALNQYDVNKLYGFAEGFNPHNNSARLGWSYNDDKLRLYAYAYKDKIRTIEEISTVTVGEILKCTIKANANYYQFSVNEKQISLARSQPTSAIKRYQLYPYFGGLETAPHLITIKIKDL